MLMNWMANLPLWGVQNREEATVDPCQLRVPTTNNGLGSLEQEGE